MIASEARQALPRTAPVQVEGLHPRWQRPWVPPLLVTSLAGLVMLAWSESQDLVLAYGDAKEHLSIARRVIDSRTPGVAQLGTVWLPIPHLALLPFVQSDFLWRTGYAGAIVGFICLLLTGLAVFFSVRLLTTHPLAPWVALLVLITNPNFLYVFTTALTEPVLFATMSMAAYYLIHWARAEDPHSDATRWDLPLAGAWSAAAVGSRYDGWAFAGAATLVVFATALGRTWDFRRAQGFTLAYVAIPTYAMLMWFLYNWQIFGNPIAFAVGQFSAAGQAGQEGRAISGQLSVSVLTYGWALVDNMSGGLVLLGAVALLLFIATKRFHTEWWGVYALMALLPFQILLLFVGQTQIVVPQLAPPNTLYNGIFNVRYGLGLLPGTAILLGVLADALARRQKLLPVLLGAAIVVSEVVAFVPDWPHHAVTIEEGIQNRISFPGEHAMVTFLDTHYHGGGILMDEGFQSFQTPAGIPLREYVLSGNGPLWRDAVANPQQVAWVVMHNDQSGDRVQAALREDPDFQKNFSLVLLEGNEEVYERENPPAP